MISPDFIFPIIKFKTLMNILQSFTESWPWKRVQEGNQVLCSTFRQMENDDPITLTLTP